MSMGESIASARPQHAAAARAGGELVIDIGKPQHGVNQMNGTAFSGPDEGTRLARMADGFRSDSRLIPLRAGVDAHAGTRGRATGRAHAAERKVSADEPLPQVFRRLIDAHPVSAAERAPPDVLLLTPVVDARLQDVLTWDVPHNIPDKLGRKPAFVVRCARFCVSRWRLTRSPVSQVLDFPALLHLMHTETGLRLTTPDGIKRTATFWGFGREHRKGQTECIFKHTFFCRDRPELDQQMYNMRKGRRAARASASSELGGPRTTRSQAGGAAPSPVTAPATSRGAYDRPYVRHRRDSRRGSDADRATTRQSARLRGSSTDSDRRRPDSRAYSAGESSFGTPDWRGDSMDDDGASVDSFDSLEEAEAPPEDIVDATRLLLGFVSKARATPPAALEPALPPPLSAGSNDSAHSRGGRPLSAGVLGQLTTSPPPIAVKRRRESDANGWERAAGAPTPQSPPTILRTHQPIGVKDERTPAALAGAGGGAVGAAAPAVHSGGDSPAFRSYGASSSAVSASATLPPLRHQRADSLE